MAYTGSGPEQPGSRRLFRIASSDRISGAGPNTPGPYSKPNGSPSARTSRPGEERAHGRVLTKALIVAHSVPSASPWGRIV